MLDNRPIVITGATGWLGQETLAYLADILPNSDWFKNVYAFGSQEKTLKIKNQEILVRPLSEISTLNLSSSPFVFHYAFITRNRIAEFGRQSFTDICLDISSQFLSAISCLKPISIFYASSGAVYDKQFQPDWYKSNPYGALKWLDEQILLSLSSKFNYSLIAPRMFGITGPCMGNRLSYAVASMIEQAKSGGPIIINAKHPVRRSYLSCRQLIEVCIKWMLDQKDPSSLIFDACGEEVVEMQDLAEVVREEAGDLSMQIIRDFNPSLPADNYLGNPEVMNSLFKRYNITPDGLQQQIINMVKSNE